MHDTVNNADVGNATLLEGDEKLPQGMGLQSLNVQELSLEQDALNDVSPPRCSINRTIILTLINQVLSKVCSLKSEIHRRDDITKIRDDEHTTKGRNSACLGERPDYGPFHLCWSGERWTSSACPVNVLIIDLFHLCWSGERWTSSA